MAEKLRANNLYVNADIIQFDNGEQLLLRRFKFTIDMFANFKYHRVIQGQELTTIAEKRYRNKVKDSSKYWWLIADVNDIFNPLDLTEYVGNDIVIPEILELKKLIKRIR
jgi:hypothetical protein